MAVGGRPPPSAPGRVRGAGRGLDSGLRRGPDCRLPEDGPLSERLAPPLERLPPEPPLERPLPDRPPLERPPPERPPPEFRPPERLLSEELLPESLGPELRPLLRKRHLLSG